MRELVATLIKRRGPNDSRRRSRPPKTRLGWPVAVIVVSTLTLSACGSSSAAGGLGSTNTDGGAVPAGSTSSSGSFVGKASNAAVFVTWTQNAGQLSGELEQGILQTDSGSGQESVNNQSISFTGTISGSSVTLSLNQGLGSTSNLTGTLNGGNLTLNYPGENGSVITLQMQPGTASTYNRNLATLQGHAGQANSQAQQAQAAKQQTAQVAQDAQTVEGDLSTLGFDVKALISGDFYSAGLSSEQQDVSQTQADMRTVLNEVGSTDSGTLCSDAGTVQSDVGAVQSDVGSIQSDRGASDSDILSVTNEIGQLQQADQALEADRQSDPVDVPPNAPNANDVAAAVKSAHAAIGRARQAAGAALAQANQMETTAAGYQAKSDAACKAAGGS